MNFGSISSSKLQENKNDQYICKTCLGYIRRQKMPPTSCSARSDMTLAAIWSPEISNEGAIMGFLATTPGEGSVVFPQYRAWPSGHQRFHAISGRFSKPSIPLRTRLTCSRVDLQRHLLQTAWPDPHSIASRPNSLRASRTETGFKKISSDQLFLIKVLLHARKRGWESEEKTTEGDPTKNARGHHLRQHRNLERERECSSCCVFKVTQLKTIILIIFHIILHLEVMIHL